MPIRRISGEGFTTHCPLTEDGVVQEFVKNKTEYLPMLTDTIKEWEEKNEMVFSTDINATV